MILAGLGGVQVETRRDVQLAVAPVDEAEATALLRSLRGAAVLDGVRGSPLVDVAAVAALIAAVGDLMADNPEIAGLDLDPMVASVSGYIPGGLAAVRRLKFSPPCE